MTATSTAVTIRPLDETDLGELVAIDEAITGTYRPRIWDDRVAYYMRRDPEGSFVATVEGKIVGFMLGEVRSFEFGMHEPSGWIEVIGVDPQFRNHAVGRQLAEAMFGHFRAGGATSVRTMVDESMQGIAQFFSALGFAPEPMRPFVKKL
jgi:ribosomal protein S18 acetylase RimI-like enzyme